MRSTLFTVQKHFPQVRKVVDSKRDVKFRVDEIDSTNADVKSHKTCAMAVACKRQLPIDGALVSLGRAFLIKGKKATRFIVPESITREIVAFDRGVQFVPGEYAFKAVPKYLQQGARLNRKRGLNTGFGQKRRVYRQTANVRAALA